MEICPNLYRIEVPLPKNPLKSINSYVIKGPDRNLVVDTGMNREVCISALQSGLNKLDVDLNETDFFITHLHADHFGLVSELATDSSKVYFNQPDADIMSLDGLWEYMGDFARMNGFPLEELMEAMQKHPGHKYSARRIPELTILKEGDTVSVGGYSFECVETPGHTPGHMCLYEREKKMLLSGDHVLGDITPNISQWGPDDQTLGQYLASLEKIYEYDVELVLPGHRSAFENCKGRIRELIDHHHVRADEVLAIIEKNSQDAYQIASQMTWDIKCDTWGDFPLMQKWFATGEALAHLKYLEHKGAIQAEVQDDRVVFSIPQAG